jgi:aldehyde:ferredoxin oxidoreductase
MGGNFPAAFKWTGLDYMVITGRSSDPVYIYVDEDTAEIRDASHLWGLNTMETEKKLEEELGKDIEVAEIGPAGEKLIRFAAISHGYGGRKRESKAGRVGGGAVMGSKNLKAIVIRASRKDVDVYDPAGLRDFVKKISRKIASDPSVGAASYRKYGTPAALTAGQKMGFFPVRYWEYGQTQYYDRLNPDILLNKYYDRNIACYNCPFACGKISSVKEGVFKGLETKGPEYETIFSFGGNAEIVDYEKLIALNLLCDRYGVDTIDAGNIISFVIYAYKNGRLKLERPVDFGDYESVLWLFEKMVHREGIGHLMGEGIKIMAEKLKLEDIAVHVKGLSLSGYDPRRLKGMALSYMIGTRGGGHLRTTAYIYEVKGIIDADDTSEEKVKYIVDREDLLSLHDSLIICRFARMLYDWDLTKEMIRHVTGFDRSIDELRETANEVRSMIRLFNVKAGVVPEKDDMLPPKLLNESVKTVDGREYTVTKEELDKMLKTYYSLRGWDEKGYPKSSP